MSARTESLHDLSSLIRSSSCVRAALVDWARCTKDPIVTKVGRRARLGLPLDAVVEPLESWPDGRVIARAIEAHAVHGGNLAATLRSIISVFQEREQMTHEAQAASSSSKLSGRLLGGLALICLIGVSTSGRFTGTTVVAMFVSVTLVCVGVMWSRRLLPRPPQADRPAAAIADLTAALLDSGLHVAGALELIWDTEDRAARLVRLGMPWADAIDRSPDPQMRQLASVLRRCNHSGTPVAGALRLLASNIREAQRREAEIAARRAPIVLVLPLTLCFLPAFALVIVAPMIGVMSG